MKDIRDISGSLLTAGQRASFLWILVVFCSNLSIAYSNQDEIKECMSHLTEVVGPKDRENLSIDTPTFGFSDGLSEVAKRVGLVDRKIVLISVYGNANAGKTHFIRGLMKRLSNEDTSYFGLGGATNLEFIRGQMVRRHQWDRAHDVKKTVIVFHCTWDRCTSSLFADDDPNILLYEHFNRGVDLNIGIYNPRMQGKLLQTEKVVRRGKVSLETFNLRKYDLIIRNPDSDIKPTR